STHRASAVAAGLSAAATVVDSHRPVAVDLPCPPNAASRLAVSRGYTSGRQRLASVAGLARCGIPYPRLLPRSRPDGLAASPVAGLRPLARSVPPPQCLLPPGFPSPWWCRPDPLPVRSLPPPRQPPCPRRVRPGAPSACAHPSSSCCGRLDHVGWTTPGSTPSFVSFYPISVMAVEAMLVLGVADRQAFEKRPASVKFRSFRSRNRKGNRPKGSMRRLSENSFA